MAVPEATYAEPSRPAAIPYRWTSDRMLDLAALRIVATPTPPDICVCGRLIPDGVVYYGFPLDPDNDEPMAYVNSWHDQCLAEWGYRPDPLAVLGISHVDGYCQ